MRPRINFLPTFASPAISRPWRIGFAVFFLLWLALAARALRHTMHRLHSGDPVYGHLVLDLFLVAYLLYLLIKIVELPPSENRPPENSEK